MMHPHSDIPSWSQPQPRNFYLPTTAVHGCPCPLESPVHATQRGVALVRGTESPAPSTQISDFCLLSNSEGSTRHLPAFPQVIDPFDNDTVQCLQVAARSQIRPSLSNHVTQECIRYFTMHPILGMAAELDHNGRVTRVYGPPLNLTTPSNLHIPLIWHGVPQTVLPQWPYVSGTKRNDWEKRQSIPFSTMGHPGVRLIDAVEGDLEGMDDWDGCPFDDQCNVVTLRTHFRGYISSTKLESELKLIEERDNAGSMRITTKTPLGKVTKEKLVKEISKRIKWHIKDLEDNHQLFPFDDQMDERWRLGSGRMKFEHMVITSIDNVSKASWSPVIHIELDPIEYAMAASLVS